MKSMLQEVLNRSHVTARTIDAAKEVDKLECDIDYLLDYPCDDITAQMVVRKQNARAYYYAITQEGVTI
jgi:hypothetical protein